MKFSVKSIVVALALLVGATVFPSFGQAQTFYGGGGVVSVRDHGHGWQRRGDDRRHWRRDGGRRAYYRDRFYGGPRYYHSGSRYGRDRGYYGHRRPYGDRQYFGRRHYRDGGVVIRLR